MEAIVDLQGFKKAFNEFVVKEFALTAAGPQVDGEVAQQCIIFDEPFPLEDLPQTYRRINGWLTRNHHGIPWDALGDWPYEDSANRIKDALVGVTRIYVKGAEKKGWLQKLLGTQQTFIEDLEDLGCPKLEEIKEGESCYQHRGYRKGTRKHYNCALRNVINLKTWYAKYHSGSIEKSLRNFCEIRDLSLMSPEDIKFLPKYFILAFASDGIDAAWDMLPTTLQMDPEIAGYRRCREHSSSTDEDKVEGPLPFKKNCALCQLVYY